MCDSVIQPTRKGNRSSSNPLGSIHPAYLKNPEDGDSTFSETSVRANAIRYHIHEDTFNWHCRENFPEDTGLQTLRDQSVPVESDEWVPVVGRDQSEFVTECTENRNSYCAEHTVQVLGVWLNTYICWVYHWTHWYVFCVYHWRHSLCFVYIIERTVYVLLYLYYE
jgi:hypothetical protein